MTVIATKSRIRNSLVTKLLYSFILKTNTFLKKIRIVNFSIRSFDVGSDYRHKPEFSIMFFLLCHFHLNGALETAPQKTSACIRNKMANGQKSQRRVVISASINIAVFGFLPRFVVYNCRA